MTQMMFELEPACESEAALEPSRDVSICSCRSFSLSFSRPAAPLNQKKGENTTVPMAGTQGPAVGKGDEGLGKSQQEDSTASRSRALQQPLAKPLWRHVASPAAREPESPPGPSSRRVGRMGLGNTPQRSAS